jgi:hypothetical protein
MTDRYPTALDLVNRYEKQRASTVQVDPVTGQPFTAPDPGAPGSPGDWSAGDAVLAAITSAQAAVDLVRRVRVPGSQRMMASHLADELQVLVKDLHRIAERSRVEELRQANKPLPGDTPGEHATRDARQRAGGGGVR